MKKHYKTVLLLVGAFVFGVGLFLICAFRPMSQKEFYDRHSIDGDSVLSSDFDKNGFKAALTKIYGQEYADIYWEAFLQYARLPEQYSGFYRPKKSILFYNAFHKQYLHQIGLSDEDINKLNIDVTQEAENKRLMGYNRSRLEQQGYYSISQSALLAARVGQNIYLVGDYGDCGTAGCSVSMYVRKSGTWVKKHTLLGFSDCLPDSKWEKYQCRLVGGKFDHAWASVAELYAPINGILEKLTDIHDDYITQYLQND